MGESGTPRHQRACSRRNSDAMAVLWAHGNAALGAGLRLRCSGRIYGTRRSRRPGAYHRASDRRWRELLRHRGAVRQWRIGKEPWPRFAKLKSANVAVGTKVRLPPSEFGRIADAVTMSLEGSLARLRLDRVDIFHLHNEITETGGGLALSVRQVLGEVVPAFERLRQQGKTRFLGLTAIGDTTALHQVIDAGVFDSAQVVYNMLNPSAATALPANNYPAQDYGRLFDHTKAAGVGVIGIRVLAGGALSGSAERHPIARPAPQPIGSAMSYDADVDRARRLIPLIKEGFATSLTEAATRFALSHAGMGTILVGMATSQQFEDALAAVQKGPLPRAALDRLSALRQAYAGEPR